jgi:hypothetical protein
MHCYRPTEPPRITGESLAAFLAAFEGLKVAEAEGALRVQAESLALQKPTGVSRY